jgi:sialate O-acetylesterase
MKYLFLLSLFVVSSLYAELTVAPIFGNGMVLQRNQEIPVWGSASPNQNVTVQLGDETVSAEADADGSWMAKLPAKVSGRDLKLVIKAGDESVLFADVVMGEVWICSGQSNMEWPLANAENGKEAVAAANYPDIRIFEVEHQTALTPKKTIQGGWNRCAPETIPEFSAVGYFFGLELYKELGVPVGLIDSNWGGTPAEAWTPIETLKAHSDYQQILERREEMVQQWKNSQSNLEAVQKAEQEFKDKAAALVVPAEEPAASLFDPAIPMPGATPIEIPSKFLYDTDGVILLRRTFEIPVGVSIADAVLRLGDVDDFDTTWVNGVQVGTTGPDVPGASRVIREYPVSASVLKPGKNVVLVRVTDWLSGSRLGMAKKPVLLFPDGDTIPLSGTWEFKLLVDMGKRPTANIRLQHAGSALYDGMISPLVPYAIRGAIWYQGETNADAKRSAQYETLFPAMIQSWREQWGQGDFPFLFVQLANYMPRKDEPGESDWAELRNAQLKTLSLPETGMAVIIDIGEAGDIHPRNKLDVGKRLARWALVETYDWKPETGFFKRLFATKPVRGGPLFKSAEVHTKSVVISFDDVGKGLTVKDGTELKGFAIAAEGKPFQWADAVIKGDTVVVSNPDVENPVAVRYAWADNPEANLFNKDGFPASPFRTDQRPLTSAGNQ